MLTLSLVIGIQNLTFSDQSFHCLSMNKFTSVHFSHLINCTISCAVKSSSVWSSTMYILSMGRIPACAAGDHLSTSEINAYEFCFSITAQIQANHADSSNSFVSSVFSSSLRYTVYGSSKAQTYHARAHSTIWFVDLASNS
jgi:hypothetical protein